MQNSCKYLIHDRDSKFCDHFDALLRSVNIEPVKLPPRSPNLNAYAERFVLSIKSECLARMILFSERSLRHVFREYTPPITILNGIIRASVTTFLSRLPSKSNAVRERSSAESG